MSRLQAKANVLAELLVAPAKTTLENLQPHRNGDKRIRARDLLTVDGSEKGLIDATEDLLIERLGPRVQELLPHPVGCRYSPPKKFFARPRHFRETYSLRWD